MITGVDLLLGIGIAAGILAAGILIFADLSEPKRRGKR